MPDAETDGRVTPGFWNSVRSWFGKSAGNSIGGAEGSWRGPFYGQSELGNMLQIGPLDNGWQRNLSVTESRYVPTVYGCVMAIARCISQGYPEHVREKDGNIEKVKTSAAYRTMNRPNDYQSISGFLLNIVAAALFDGESFALAVRNDRNEVIALHQLPRNSCRPYVDSDGAIYYAVSRHDLINNVLIEPDMMVPMRDIFHLRYYTPRHPLLGESAIKAAALAVGINVALSVSQAAFFSQMNRPSGVLTTDQQLSKEQMQRLRAAFDAQSERLAQGGLPILSNGLKFSAMSLSNEDAQLIEAMRMSTQEICRVFGVPPPLVGDLGDATLNNSETLIQYFMSLSLGSYLDQTEREFDRIFGFTGAEYIQLDMSALLRTDFEKRIEGLTKAVQGGLLTPDEARAKEGYGKIDGGNSAYLQRQMVPIDRIGPLLDKEIEDAEKPDEAIPGEFTDVPPEPALPADPDVAKALVMKMLSDKRAAA